MDFSSEAASKRERLREDRRDFHRHPEVGFRENRTGEIIANRLESLGFQVKRSVGRTGVVGVLVGGRSGPVTLCRFDMDALPIVEVADHAYQSAVCGVMHACGHDGHMAIGLGLAELLVDRVQQLPGTVALLFQPAEEIAEGARAMMEEGVVDDLSPDYFLACHIWLDLPVGSVDVSIGPVMAAAEEFRCVVEGCGGHGAMPHLAVDPIVTAAHLVANLQSVVSRCVSPLDTAVVSVGSIHGGDAMNIIPPRVELSGTIRTYLPDTRERTIRAVEAIVEHTTAAHGASAQFELKRLTPAVCNDERVAGVVRRAAQEQPIVAHLSSSVRTMGSEDAAYFLDRIPGCFFFVGGANEERGLTAGHHHPSFDFDEECLVIGLSVMAASVFRLAEEAAD